MEYIDLRQVFQMKMLTKTFRVMKKKIMTIDLLSMTAKRLMVKNRAFIENFSTKPEIQQKLFLMMMDRISTPEICSLKCFLQKKGKV